MMSSIQNKRTVLVTAIGGDIGQTYAKSITGEEFVIMGCDVNAWPGEHSVLQQFFRVPSASNSGEYLESIKSIVEKAQVDIVVPISEPEIKAFHESREIWSSWNVKVLINNSCILDHFLDKYKTAMYLRSIGIKVPETFLLDEYQGELSFPAIVKSRTGCGSRNVWKVESDIDLTYCKQKSDGNFLIQECIGTPDQEYTTGIFSDGTNVSSITFKRKLGLGSLSVEVELVDDPFLEHMARIIAAQTGLVGAINVQSRLDRDEFIPFEINPRFSSTVGFRKHFGFPDCLWWPRVSVGESYSYTKLFKAGRGTRYLTERYVGMEPI